MKKIISSVLAVFMLLSCLVACGSKQTVSEVWIDESGETVIGEEAGGSEDANDTDSEGTTSTGKTSSGSKT